MRRIINVCTVVSLTLGSWLGMAGAVHAQESPYLYGIHDHDTNIGEYLDHLAAGGVTGWVTATVAIGSDPGNTGGDDFRWISDRGHTVIVRLNNGYCGSGTIPTPDRYDDFAQRAANYAAATQGASHFIIGNETNLAGEWPPAGGHAAYVSPQDYAAVFRKAYDAIKAVRPDATIISQALAPFAGPYSAGSTCGFSHDANPLNWVQYLNQMLTAIKATGGIDGIALHINSRGYTYGDIHSTQKINAGGQDLFFSFYVYKDWIDYGIPPDLYDLPLYATEANGIYYWSGGHPERPDSHYEAGWMQEIYAEIDRYNQAAAAEGKPIFRAVNLYRWCAWCDGWNIDGSPYKGQILADLDQAVAAGYRWPDGGSTPPPTTPPGDNVALGAAGWSASSSYPGDYGGDRAYDGVVSAASKWTSDGSSPESWLALDLGADFDVTGFIVRHAGAAGEDGFYNTSAFRLEAGETLSGPWAILATVDNPVQDDVSTIVLASPATTRHVRLVVTDAGVDDYARIPELEVYGSAADTNLIGNGGFADGLAGWTAWTQRGSPAVTVVDGRLRVESGDHNGGVYQQFATGGAGSVIDVGGFWESNPTAANSQWAEVLVIDGSRLPADGEDVTESDGDVVMIYKNDTWASPGGWSGAMAQTAPVRSTGTLTVSGDVATLVLKSGNVSGVNTGTRFDDLVVERKGPPSTPNTAPTAVAAASPISGDAPLAVSFDATASSDPDGDALSFAWAFGDGASGAGVTPTHTYSAAGTHTAAVTVDDGRGGSDTDAVTITVTTPGTEPGGGWVVLETGSCPGTCDFAQIRADLQAEGKELGLVKIGFHVSPTGNQQGLGDWERALDAAGVPFFLKSVDSAGQIWEAVQLKAASGCLDNTTDGGSPGCVPHRLVYRRSVTGADWRPDVPYTGSPDCANPPPADTPYQEIYNETPYDAALAHWQRHRAEFPPELEPYRHLIWVETINEVNRGGTCDFDGDGVGEVFPHNQGLIDPVFGQYTKESEWIAEFAIHTANLAMADGFNWAAFGWSSGEPEIGTWAGPKMREFLALAAANPGRIAVALHEYSYTTDGLQLAYPYLIGRFQELYEVADHFGIARPPVVITEFGWTLNDIPDVDQSMNIDLPWAAELYAPHPEIEGAAIWYLGSGWGGIDNEVQKLIGPMADYAASHYFVLGRLGGAP